MRHQSCSGKSGEKDEKAPWCVAISGQNRDDHATDVIALDAGGVWMGRLHRCR